MTQAQSIVGYSVNRAPNDFYPTPPFATQKLLEKVSFSGDILEPACGEGHISKVLEENKLTVISNDLIDYGYGTPNVNFLTYHVPVDNVITNPPYKLATEFVLQAKQVATGKIAFLLKTVFLEGASRYPLFKDQKFPLEYVLQFSKRLTLTANGVPMKNSGMIAYAWFVWNKEYKGEPKLDWIL